MIFRMTLIVQARAGGNIFVYISSIDSITLITSFCNNKIHFTSTDCINKIKQKWVKTVPHKLPLPRCSTIPSQKEPCKPQKSCNFLLLLQVILFIFIKPTNSQERNLRRLLSNFYGFLHSKKLALIPSIL